jgi:hypothetical protein
MQRLLILSILAIPLLLSAGCSKDSSSKQTSNDGGTAANPEKKPKGIPPPSKPPDLPP